MHLVCHSGGHESALVGIEVVRRFGAASTVLLNHDIPGHTEDADIKRFKAEVADYLGVPITYASHADPADTIIYYGFNAAEPHRIQRRSGIMGAQGWRTDYPLIWKDRTIHATSEVGIARPLTYSVYKHGNCTGCLKAGWQHWYVVYCTRADIWAKAKWAEEEIGYAIHHDETGPVYLEDMEPKFAAMREAGIPATEHIDQQRFWAQTNRIITINAVQATIPCECM